MRWSHFLFIACTCSGLHAHPGVGLVRDSQGTVFYTDLKHVWKIPAGTKQPVIAVKDVHTHELCLEPNGDLYGEHLWYNGEKLDTWGQRTWRLAADGTLANLGTARDAFKPDVSFVRDAAGTQFFRERQPDGREVFRRRTHAGVSTRLIETVAFRDVRWMTAAPNGTLYLIDRSDLWRITPDAKPKLLARSLAESSAAEQRHRVQGLCADDAGNVWVAVHDLRAVKKVTADGTVSVVARARFPWAPSGVLAVAGDLWLLECTLTNQVRVRHLASDGKETVY